MPGSPRRGCARSGASPMIGCTAGGLVSARPARSSTRPRAVAPTTGSWLGRNAPSWSSQSTGARSTAVTGSPRTGAPTPRRYGSRRRRSGASLQLTGSSFPKWDPESPSGAGPGPTGWCGHPIASGGGTCNADVGIARPQAGPSSELRAQPCWGILRDGGRETSRARSERSDGATRAAGAEERGDRTTRRRRPGNEVGARRPAAGERRARTPRCSATRTSCCRLATSALQVGS